MTAGALEGVGEVTEAAWDMMAEAFGTDLPWHVAVDAERWLNAKVYYGPPTASHGHSKKAGCKVNAQAPVARRQLEHMIHRLRQRVEA